ncbi:MAG: AI-2E family transporter, partial [Flavobacteriales bacterium]|nr:AI-2E family transporter [Flavobacteriales bacterium]
SRAKENLIVIYHNVLDIAASYGVIDDAAAFSPDFIKNIDFSFLPNLINNIVSSVGSVMIMIFAVLFFAFFFLKERNRVTSFILSIVPDGSEGKMSQMMTKTSHLLSRYVIGLLIQMSIIFTFTLILLITFGVDTAFLTATVVALLNVVPYIGPFMGGTMIVIFTMLGGIGQPDMIYTTLYVLGGFLLIQFFDNFISQPVIFSSSVKAHPLEIFTVTLIGGTLMGIIGMIVAVPLYTLVRIIAKEFFWEFKIVRVFTKDI